MSDKIGDSCTKCVDECPASTSTTWTSSYSHRHLHPFLTTARCAAVLDQTVPPNANSSASPSTQPGTSSECSADQTPSSAPVVATAHYSYYMGESKEKELRALYHSLDRNKDGTVGIKELTDALRTTLPTTQKEKAVGYAKTIFQRATQKSDSQSIDFYEFVHYVLEHEKKLAVVFDDVDADQDGKINAVELTNYFKELGVSLTPNEADRLLQKMTKNGQASVNLAEFQKFLLFHPNTDPKQLISFWKHNLIIDIGEDQALPEEFTAQEIAGGLWWRHLVAGGLAGAVSRTCTAPLDRLKVYMQVHAGPRGLGVLRSFQFLLREGGFKSFWRGNGVNVLKIAPESAIKFLIYEKAKRQVMRLTGSEEITGWQRMCAGSVAGLASQTVIYPLEVMKTRLALRHTGELNQGIWHAAKTLYGKEGVRTFYRGYLPNSIGIIPYAGIDLAVYETLRNLYIAKYSDTDEPSVLAVLGCGTISSTSGMLCAYPLALVRTRLQATAITMETKSASPDTMVGQFSHILRAEGVRGLYTGILPNIMKVIPAVSCSYVVYELTRKQLGATMS